MVSLFDELIEKIWFFQVVGIYSQIYTPRKNKFGLTSKLLYSMYVLHTFRHTKTWIKIRTLGQNKHSNSLYLEFQEAVFMWIFLFQTKQSQFIWSPFLDTRNLPKPFYHPALCDWVGERKYNTKFMGWDKD